MSSVNVRPHYLAVLRAWRNRSKPSPLHCWEFLAFQEGKLSLTSFHQKKCFWSFTITGWHPLFCATHTFTHIICTTAGSWIINQEICHLWGTVGKCLSNLFTRTHIWTQTKIPTKINTLTLYITWLNMQLKPFQHQDFVSNRSNYCVNYRIVQKDEQNQPGSAGEDWGSQPNPLRHTCTSHAFLPFRWNCQMLRTLRRGEICRSFVGVKRQRRREQAVAKEKRGQDFLSVLSTSRGTVEGHAP